MKRKVKVNFFKYPKCFTWVDVGSVTSIGLRGMEGLRGELVMFNTSLDTCNTSFNSSANSAGSEGLISNLGTF